jgi:hypothetical protein
VIRRLMGAMQFSRRTWSNSQVGECEKQGACRTQEERKCRSSPRPDATHDSAHTMRMQQYGQHSCTPYSVSQSYKLLATERCSAVVMAIPMGRLRRFNGVACACKIIKLSWPAACTSRLFARLLQHAGASNQQITLSFSTTTAN